MNYTFNLTNRLFIYSRFLTMKEDQCFKEIWLKIKLHEAQFYADKVISAS